MFVYSIKGQNLKLYTSIAVSLLAVILVISFVPPASVASYENQETLAVGNAAVEPNFKKIKTNEDRIAFLSQYGWKCESAPCDATDWIIPVTFDPMYEKYNEMQLQEGLDLSLYKGKNVKRYRYVVTNYEHPGTVYATLILYKDRVIGGDLSSSTGEPFTHGFTKGNDFPG